MVVQPLTHLIGAKQRLPGEQIAQRVRILEVEHVGSVRRLRFTGGALRSERATHPIQNPVSGSVDG
jgi:hypothetical protein